jgi:hypothetical protein
MLRENMEGIERPEFPVIKILHAGALMFQMPPDEEGEVKQVKDFSAQILLHQRVNAYWEKSYEETGGGVPPDCSSLDGIIGSVHGECLKCKFNQFGSELTKDGSQGSGKACKNMMRIYVRIGQDLLPSVLIVPPTSLREYSAYAVKLTQKAKPLPVVLSKFSLEPAQNKQGIKYSKLVCSMEKVLTEKEFKEGLAMRKVYENHMKQRPIEADVEEQTPEFARD